MQQVPSPPIDATKTPSIRTASWTPKIGAFADLASPRRKVDSDHAWEVKQRIYPMTDPWEGFFFCLHERLKSMVKDGTVNIPYMDPMGYILPDSIEIEIK